MVATSDLGSDAERRGGSSPFIRTKATSTGCFFAYKGTRTDCGGSADLSAVVDCASCYATTNIGRVLATQASLELTLTPYSTPSVSPPNQTTLVCSRSAERSSSSKRNIVTNHLKQQHLWQNYLYNPYSVFLHEVCYLLFRELWFPFRLHNY